DSLALRHRGDNGRAEVLGVGAREPDALDPLEGVARAQQLPELGADVRREVPTPRIDVLTEQRDLANALGGEPRHLRDDLAGPAPHLPAAHRRDDAVGAPRVAAHRDLDPRLERPFAVHRKLARERPLIEAEPTPGDPEAAGAEPLAEMRDRARAECDVDLGIEIEQTLALRLRVATADCDDGVRMLPLVGNRLAEVGGELGV